MKRQKKGITKNNKTMDNFLTRFDVYDPNTNTYSHGRSAGLFAMLNWILRQITLLEMTGKKIDNIELYLDEYMHRKNSFNDLFVMNNQDLDLYELPEETKNDFLNKTNWSYIGFSNNPNDIDLSITNKVINKYFNPNEEVMKWYNYFVEYLGGDLNKIIFIWARATDKYLEVKLPMVETYVRTLFNIDCDEKKIVVQTDDRNVLDRFEKIGLDFDTLPYISSNKVNNQPFHLNLRSWTDHQFQEVYGISKLDHLRQMIALSLICKNSYKTILYPGNPISFITSMKGTTEDLILFKNENEFFVK